MANAIDDGGLWLAVLNALVHSEHLDRDELGKRIADADIPEDGSERARVAEAIHALQQVKVDADALAAIEALDFDGGNEIYALIEAQLGIDTGGEADYYQLESLAGIDQLRSLTKLDLDCHGGARAGVDLGPLTGHPRLASACLAGSYTGVAALETLPALRRLNVRLVSKLDDPAVLDRLAARGVEIVR